jgi:competence ComEA-like helix-hairpin-helix protein
MRTSFLQDYFYFTRLERNAGIVLCLLCALAYSLPMFYHWLSPPASKTDFAKASELAATLVPADKPEKQQDPYFAMRGNESTGTNQSVAVKLFPFDPNTASKDDLMRLGLPARTAQTILNYREKGGHFFKKEDLKRLYTLRAEDYDRLEPFVQIPPRADSQRQGDFSKKPADQGFVTTDSRGGPSPAPQNFTKKPADAVVDINAASAEEWQQLRGVGPGWAKRIINFREKLGGFTSLEQVAETRGLPDSVFQKILPNLRLVSPVFRRMNINSATLDELKQHPYLSSFQATVLFNYRLQHGSYPDFASLKKVKAGFSEADWARLEPYLDYD